MIKEKHETGPDSVKEEPGSSEKDSSVADVRIKKEEEAAGSCKKEPGRSVTKNGGIIGSTNAGSLQAERKTEPEEADPSALVLKSEECDSELPSDAFLGLAGPPAGEGVQPLASNVISKQPGGMEVQYMQQQSQIFVFSTVMANRGADEVLQGRFPTIIAYHCAQPATKKYLEKCPLKMNQFTRQNPAQWLNNLAMMKNKGCTRSPGLSKSQPSLDTFLGPDGLDEIGLGDGDLPWDQKNNHLEGLEGVSNGLPDMDGCGVQPSLQGVKVPDENLTPQQRQHREEQLATIRKMQQMLFPESSNCRLAPLPDGQSLDAGVPPSGLDVPHLMSDWPKPGPAGAGGATRPPLVQGPPPPYHQTPRSASVPIALQSPSPASPNPPTSNLSLPSPRASSALNSPADPSRPPFPLARHVAQGQSPTSQDSPSNPPRHTHSNPGTPVSSHLSPTVNSSTEPASSSHQSSVDGMFGRTLQSMAQQKQMNTTSSCSTTPSAGKEPNLMPVPSPQQIQYLNAFEGQELIIQKQPNTSLKERNIISPPILPTTLDSGFPSNATDIPHRISGPNTPTSVDVGPRFPPTPGVPSEGCRFQIPSPHTPSAPTGEKSQRLTSAPGMSPQTAPGPNSDPLKGDLFPTPSPHMMDVPRFPGPNASPVGAKMGGGFVNVSPSGKPLDMPNYCARGDNVPLNPNCTSAIPGNPKAAHFDPISSLAQMSQQLTNSVASSLNGAQGGQGPGGMMNFGSPSMQMMEMGACHGMPPDLDQGPMMGMGMQGPPHGFHPGSPMAPIRSLSPKLPGAFPNHMPIPRMMGRPPGPPGPGPNPYNGANVQVKPNAPNTIQYLPAKPQVGASAGPRGPPSLDFLRFAGPMPNMESKMPSQNLQYFPNNGPMQGPGHGPHAPPGPMPPHMGHMDGGPMQNEAMMGGPMGNGGGPMMGGMMMPMMRGPMRPPPGGMMRLPQMGFNGPPPPEMFSPGPGQMFVGGPKGSPMGMAPDASQPLPPSMGQGGTFKNSPFVGPTTTDPNYAQQYHNFQQQLYATGTRTQMGGMGGVMGPGPGPPPHAQQPPYFNPK